MSDRSAIPPAPKTPAPVTPPLLWTRLPAERQRQLQLLLGQLLARLLPTSPTQEDNHD